MSEVERRPNGLSEKEEALITDIANKIIALAQEKKFSFIPTWEQYDLSTSGDAELDDSDVIIYDEITELFKQLDSSERLLLRKNLEFLFKKIEEIQRGLANPEKPSEKIRDPEAEENQIR